MSWFRKDKVIDLGESYKRKSGKVSETKKEEKDVVSSGFNFLGNLAEASSVQANNNSYKDNESTEERKKRLAKRIIEMTNRIEELSNQIYHLQQRIEVLEKKSNVENSEYYE